jgi:hypothetical protein
MVEQAFRRIDIDGDGRLSRAKVLSACNDDDEVRALLSLPHHVCSSM